MSNNTEVVPGLFFSMNKIEGLYDNVASMERTEHGITLACIITLPEYEASYPENVPVHEIKFEMHHSFLRMYETGLNSIDYKNFPGYMQPEVCCNTQLIVSEIVNSRHRGAFRTMFLHSKAIELFLCFARNTAPENFDCASCRFLGRPVEKEKIVKARELLLKSLQHPPTISELALAAGINQCYLKKGFKELYQTTIYDFIQEQRMLRARLLLNTNRYTVSQVAEEIGFSGVSSFSTAFKKHTGVFPSELLQAL